MTFSIQLEPAPLRTTTRYIGSAARTSGAIVAPIEWPMRPTFVASKVAGLVVPGQSLTSSWRPARTCAKRAYSAADSRTLSRSAAALLMLNIRKSSLSFVRFRRSSCGPSTVAPATPAFANQSAGPVPGAIGGPPLVACGPRSTSGRSPPPPVRMKCTMGQPPGGIGVRGIVTNIPASSVRCCTGLPDASKAQAPPVLANV